MKKCLTLLLIQTLLFAALHAQIFSDEESGNTYALVVGISEYQFISNLKFAHRDAEIFKNYLLSDAGGKVPEDNIYYFTNATATSPAIYDALAQIKKRVQKDDKVIIYFSGHGQRETEEYNNLGYLLTYNTPESIFRNNALRIEDLNLDAQTLTLLKGAEVIFFIDACYAGELSGVVNKGPDLSAREQETKSNKEVRFMACRAKEKSLEVSELDGGRGVFSHFLVKGLLGEADNGANGVVTKKELAKYLEDEMERFMSTREHDQTPISEGENNDFRLAMVDVSTFSMLQSSAGSALAALNINFGEEAPPVAAMAAPVTEVADVNSEVEPSEVELSKGLDTGQSGSAAFLAFQKAINTGVLLSKADESSAYKIYQDQISTGAKKEELERMKSRLVVALQEEAQKAINAYFSADSEELNRRLYIEHAQSYSDYPVYLRLAAELVGPDYRSYNAIKSKQYYFAGINYRLTHLMDTTYKEEDFKKAMELQQQALSFDDKAAYVYNELGILYNLSRDRTQAQAAFEKAHRTAPFWVIPMTNLAALHFKEDRIPQAKDWALKAVAQRKNDDAANMILGKILAKANNHLFAESHYRRALLNNWSNFRPFESLAQYYTRIGQYQLADHLFKEAAFRKNGIYPVFIALPNDVRVNSPGVDFNHPLLNEEELLQRIRKNRNDYEAWHGLGMSYTQEQRYTEAESSFLQVARINPEYCPLYQSIGDLYKLWNRIHDALIWYEKGLTLSKTKSDTEISGICDILKLAKSMYPLYEDMERYEESERLITAYLPDELWNFYDRMIKRFPENPNYWYKRGLLVYNENKNTNPYAINISSSFYDVQWEIDSFYTINDTLMGVSTRYLSKFLKLPDTEYWDVYWGNPVITDFEKVLDLASDYPTRGDIYYKLSQMYATRGQLYLDAVFEESRMLKEGFNSEQNIQYQHYKNFVQQTQKAIENSNVALAFYPSKAEVHCQLADLHQRLFEPEKAIDYLYQLRDKNWLSPHYRRNLAKTQLLIGQVDSAYHSLSYALDQNVGPEREDHELASFIFQFKGDYKAAIKQLEQAQGHYDQASGTPYSKAYINYRKAVLFALDKKSGKAREALEAAFENGFAYRHVVQNDPAFKDMSDQQKFQNLLSDYGMDDPRIVD